MTVDAAERPGRTSSGPTAGSTLRAVRGPVVVGALLLAALATAALVGRSGPDGLLEPDSYSPVGARAVVELLRDRGLEVRRVDSVQDALGGSARTTVLLPAASSLTSAELARLTARPGELVVVGAEQEQVDALGAGVDAGAPATVEQRRPACDLPAAVTAGDVQLGGPTYRATRGSAVGCYASAGRPTLLRLPALRVTLLGDGTLLTNDRLDERGNAALALGLLGTGDEVRWLVPAAGRTAEGGGQTPLGDLLPDWVGAGALQLLLAAAVLALWRARRLGRVVTEPLPVVVRSAEAVEGRARLYRAAGARDRAAASLRAAARSRLARRLGLPPAAASDEGRGALVGAVALRTGSSPAEVEALLFGGVPPDEAALVRLADALDGLAQDLREGRLPAPSRSEGGSTA